MEYRVVLVEKVYYEVKVDAKSAEDAEEKAWEEFSNGSYKEVFCEMDVDSINKD